MELKNIFSAVADFFSRERIKYAVIGAYALYAYGYVRATKDMDFVIDLENQRKIIVFLESLGFETTHCTTAFSNHVLAIGETRVDIMYVEGATSRKIFSSTRNMLLFKDLQIPVVSPEHLMAMKVFAIKNNTSRKFKDLGDIQELLNLTDLDDETVRKCFEKYEMSDVYEEFKENKTQDS